MTNRSIDWLLDHDFEPFTTVADFEAVESSIAEGCEANTACAHYDPQVDSVCGRHCDEHPEPLAEPRPQPTTKLFFGFGDVEVIGNARERFIFRTLKDEVWTVRNRRYVGSVHVTRAGSTDTGVKWWERARESTLRREDGGDVVWKTQDNVCETIREYAAAWADSPDGQRFLREAEVARLERDVYHAEVKIRSYLHRIAKQQVVIRQTKEQIDKVRGER